MLTVQCDSTVSELFEPWFPITLFCVQNAQYYLSNHRRSRSLDIRLLNITKKEWFERRENEVEGIGFTRRPSMIKALKIQLGQLKSDIPKHNLRILFGHDWLAMNAFMTHTILYFLHNLDK